MSDTELDDILNSWTTPDPPPSLRGRVRAGYAELRPRRSRFRLLFWTLATGFAIFLFFLTAAFPQTAKLLAPAEKVPFTVESYYMEVAPDGSIAHERGDISYLRGGQEIVLSQWIPGNPVGSFAMGAMNGFHHFLHAALSPLFGNAEPEPDPKLHAALVAAGCVDGPVIGHETILDYQVVDIQRVDKPGRRVVVAMAPALSCFAMKLVGSARQPDGSWRLVWERDAVKVTVNSVQ